MNLREKFNPIRILFFMALMIVIIGVTAPPAFAQREVDPAGPSDGEAIAGTPHGTVTASASNGDLSVTATATSKAGAKATQPVAGGPKVWTDGTKICLASRYALAWHWNHAGGSDGLPRVAMTPVGDHYEVNLGAVPTEDFTFGFTDRNQSDGVRESRWLPGNVAGFKQGNPWVIPHSDDPGCDFVMKVGPGRMWLADPAEVAAYRRAKLAGK